MHSSRVAGAAGHGAPVLMGGDRWGADGRKENNKSVAFFSHSFSRAFSQPKGDNTPQPHPKLGLYRYIYTKTRLSTIKSGLAHSQTPQSTTLSLPPRSEEADVGPAGHYGRCVVLDDRRERASALCVVIHAASM